MEPRLTRYIERVAGGQTTQPANIGESAHGAGATRKATTTGDLFDQVAFSCEVYKIGTNAAGDWMVTIKVPFYDRDAITQLSGAFGMNLNTTMVSNGFAD